MTLITQQFTACELFEMPGDGFRCELVKGELKKIAPAGHVHGRIIINISTPLDTHVRTNQLGLVFAAETGFQLASNPDTVRAPDVAFVRAENVKSDLDQRGYWPGAPDLVVEVISPGDIYTEVEEKVFDWLEAGTKMVVVVNPRKRVVTVYRSLTEIVVLTENDVLDGKELIPNWSLPVKTIFA
ncbi:MAG: Uma2 family endonuclease [Acidobacteria bacterium]|nr:Uma2 family endonuclease [Acidobacteriota bacterium]